MYLARGLKFEEPEREGTEIIRIVKTSLREAVTWMMENKITHGATTTLVLKANHLIAMESG